MKQKRFTTRRADDKPPRPIPTETGVSNLLLSVVIIVLGVCLVVEVLR